MSFPPAQANSAAFGAARGTASHMSDSVVSSAVTRRGKAPPAAGCVGTPFRSPFDELSRPQARLVEKAHRKGPVTEGYGATGVFSPPGLLGTSLGIGGGIAPALARLLARCGGGGVSSNPVSWQVQCEPAVVADVAATTPASTPACIARIA